jgi:hypothetical protein
LGHRVINPTLNGARSARAIYRQGLEFKTASLLRASRLFRDIFCFFAAATSSHADDLKGATGRTMTRSSSPDRHKDRFDTDDVHHAREVVGEHVQRHLGRQFWAAYSSESASPPYPSSARQTDPRRSRGQYACIRMLVQGRLHNINSAFCGDGMPHLGFSVCPKLSENSRPGLRPERVREAVRTAENGKRGIIRIIKDSF